MYLGADPIQDQTSYEVPKKELKATGCFTTLNVKRTVHENLCDDALKHLKQKLATHIYENGTDIPPTTETPLTGNWVALAIPDCIPSRLDILTRFVSLIFLWDDAHAAAVPTRKDNEALNNRFTRGLEEALPTLDETPQAPPRHVNTSTQKNRRRRTSVEKILHPLVTDLLAQDQAMGLEVLESWRKHYNNLPNKSSPNPFPSPTLTSYLHTSLHSFPSAPWSLTLRYALGIHLTDETDLIAPALESAFHSIILTKDYWSWPLTSRHTDNTKRLANAVAVSMAEHDCSEDEALGMVRSAALEAEGEFLRRKEVVLAGLEEGGSEVVMFLEGLEAFVAGWSFWCSTCPRLRGRF